MSEVPLQLKLVQIENPEDKTYVYKSSFNLQFAGIKQDLSEEMISHLPGIHQPVSWRKTSRRLQSTLFPILSPR